MFGRNLKINFGKQNYWDSVQSLGHTYIENDSMREIYSCFPTALKSVRLGTMRRMQTSRWLTDWARGKFTAETTYDISHFSWKKIHITLMVCVEKSFYAFWKSNLQKQCAGAVWKVSTKTFLLSVLGHLSVSLHKCCLARWVPPALVLFRCCKQLSGKWYFGI